MSNNLIRGRLNQAGDTIVEVLIAIAVISSVLGTAYAVVNSATKTSQQSQEHSRALAIAESQIERIKVNEDAQDEQNPFCFSESGTGLEYNIDNCKFDDGDVVDRYNTVVNKDVNGNFTVDVTWDGPKGRQESVSLIYKIFPVVTP